MIEALRPDLRDTDLWVRAETHFRTLHAPGFDRPTEPTEPAISADGSVVACSVVLRHDLESPVRQAVLVITCDGERLIEVPSGSVRQPRFGPDAVDLAVLVDHSGSGKWGVGLVHDGRVEPTPPLSGNVEQIHWSPSGHTIAALVADPGADAAGAQGSGRTSRGDTPPWMPTVRADAPTGGWRRVWVLHVGESAWHLATDNEMTTWELCWSGDTHLLAVTSDRPEEAAWFDARLVRIDLASGEVTTVAEHDHRCVGLPAGSVDGRWAAIVQATCSDRTVVAGDVTLIDLSDGTVRTLDTAGIDVTWQAFTSDGHLIAAGIRGLETVVLEVGVDGRSPIERWSATDLTCGQRYPDLAATAGGVAMVVEGYRQAPELAVLADGAPQIRSTFTHDGHRAVLSDAGDARPVEWRAPDGSTISGIVVTPVGAGPHPTVTYVHGGPVWAWRSRWSMGYPYTLLLARMGYAVFHPNPRGSTGRGEMFRAAVLGDLGGAESDDILSGLDELERIGISDPSRHGVLGGSHGGFMAAWLVTVTDRFRAALPYCPVTDWSFMSLTTNDPTAQEVLLAGRPGRSPLEHAHRVSTPCLIVTGSHDLITPASQGLAFHRALAQRGVPTGYIEYPLEGHGVRTFPAQIDMSARTLGWFDTYLRVAH